MDFDAAGEFAGQYAEHHGTERHSWRRICRISPRRTRGPGVLDRLISEQVGRDPPARCMADAEALLSVLRFIDCFVDPFGHIFDRFIDLVGSFF